MQSVTSHTPCSVYVLDNQFAEQYKKDINLLRINQKDIVPRRPPLRRHLPDLRWNRSSSVCDTSYTQTSWDTTTAGRRPRRHAAARRRARRSAAFKGTGAHHQRQSRV